ncbi:MAG: helix-turn-helix domain-containing protein [Bacteroidota bacterium]
MEEINYATIGFIAGIILLACLHGLLLAGIFYFHPRFNTHSSKFLALATLGMSIILGYEFIFWLELDQRIDSWLLFVVPYLRTTIPMGLYGFVIFLLQPEHKLSTFEKMGFASIGLEFLIDLTFIPAESYVQSTQQLDTIVWGLTIFGWFLSIVVALAYIPRALRKVVHYQKYIFDHYSTTDRKSLRWLQNFLVLFLVMTVFWIISFVYYVIEDYDTGDLVFLIVTVGLVTLLFWIGYFLILNYHWFQIATVPPQEDEKPQTPAKLSTNTDQYYQQLIALIEKEKVYEDVQLTLEVLAERLDISSGYLSQIIKEKEQKTFFEFINDFRVEAVKAKLIDPEYQHYTIMGIASECGFNSKSTFNAVFKKFTNETPSAYQKRHLVS